MNSIMAELAAAGDDAANPRLSRKCRSLCASQNGDCHQFPPLELAGCTRFALRRASSSRRVKCFLITRDSPENADRCARRKTGTATNSRFWNWLAVPGLPYAELLH